MARPKDLAKMQLIRELTEKGKTSYQIADEIGLSQSQVNKYQIQMGINNDEYRPQRKNRMPFDWVY